MCCSVIYLSLPKHCSINPYLWCAKRLASWSDFHQMDKTNCQLEIDIRSLLQNPFAMQNSHEWMAQDFAQTPCPESGDSEQFDKNTGPIHDRPFQSILSDLVNVPSPLSSLQTNHRCCKLQIPISLLCILHQVEACFSCLSDTERL